MHFNFNFTDLRNFPVLDPNLMKVDIILPPEFPVNHHMDDLVTPLNVPVVMKRLDVYVAGIP